jgi:hypothetical protein
MNSGSKKQNRRVNNFDEPLTPDIMRIQINSPYLEKKTLFEEDKAISTPHDGKTTPQDISNDDSSNGSTFIVNQTPNAATSVASNTTDQEDSDNFF